jgi:betaine-aldehyde dehydrogenase
VTFVLRAQPEDRQDLCKPGESPAARHESKWERMGTSPATEVGTPSSSVLARVRAITDRPWKMLIDGELRGARSGQSIPVVYPGDGTQVGQLPGGDAADVDDAVAAAKAASAAWARTAAADRGRMLLALADAVERNGEELAWIDTVDNGSPIAVMRNDYVLAVEQLRYFAGLALQVRGETIPVSARDAIDFTLRDPFGVVGRLVPFNHPLMFAASRVAAPLLAGNAVVLKPSEQTSLSALRLGELAGDIFPPGVLNVVCGTGERVGDPLVAHPDVPRIAFTGSEAVGRRILGRAAQTGIKTVTLELGGKNPIIVFVDADLDAALDGAVRGMNFRWQGQSCGSTSRLFVQRRLYRPFIEGLAERMRSLTVGDPTLESTDVGPVVSLAQYDRVRRFIETGLRDPALELVAGGDQLSGPGFFIPPTLFSATDDFSATGAGGGLFAEEIFGPVLVAAPFDDYDEAIRHANSLPLGLTASVWTTDLHTALAAARDIQTGYLWVNWSSEHIPGSSFGGVKNSGIGREEGLQEIESYTQSKNVYIRF